MAYIGRDWDNTGTEVTKDDFKRMDNGIKSNDAAITEQATKIAENSNQINVLNIDRGYLSTNTTLKDFNLANKNGKYILFGGALNSPVSGSYAIALDVTCQTSDTLTQTTKVLWGTNSGAEYTRICASNSWQPWREIATTTRRELTGYDIRGGFSYRISHDQSVVKVGNLCTLTACLNTSICQVGTVVLQIPEGYRPIKPVGVACLYGGRGDTCLAEVMTSGEVRLWDFSTPMTTGGFLWINLTYRVV